MMTAAESTDLFKAKPIVKTDPIPDSLIVLELVRKHDTPDLIESANFFISTISVGYSSLFYRLKTLTESSQVLFLKRKYNFFSEYANMMTAAESTYLFKAKPIVKTDPIPDSLIVLELVRKHDTPDLIESANFFISTISVGYRSLFTLSRKTENNFFCGPCFSSVNGFKKHYSAITHNLKPVLN